MPSRSFKGKAGTIYIESSDDGDTDVWFEDFCIIGQGKSEREALEDAVRHVENIGTLVSTAIVELGAAAASGD